MLNSHNIEGIVTSVKNPQANLVKRVYQTLGNIIHLHDTKNKILDPMDPFTDILCACMWAMCSTVHTILKATPGQLVFRRDIIFDLSFKTKWKDVLDNRKWRMLENNERKNQS